MPQILVECVFSPGACVTCCSLPVIVCVVMEVKAQLSQSWSVSWWVNLSAHLLAPGAPLLKGGWGEHLRGQPGVPQANHGVCVCSTWNAWFLDTQGVGITEQCWGMCVYVCVFRSFLENMTLFQPFQPWRPSENSLHILSINPLERLKRRGFDAWVRKIPWRRKWQPTPVLLPGESHDQRSLVGYSPCGHKELDMTEHTHTPWGKPHMYRKVRGFPVVLHAQRQRNDALRET